MYYDSDKKLLKSPERKLVETKDRDTTLGRIIPVPLHSGVRCVQMDETESTYHWENDEDGRNLLMWKKWTKNIATETHKTVRFFSRLKLKGVLTS